MFGLKKIGRLKKGNEELTNTHKMASVNQRKNFAPVFESMKFLSDTTNNIVKILKKTTVPHFTRRNQRNVFTGV